MMGQHALRSAACSLLWLLSLNILLRGAASNDFDYFYIVREWNPTFCFEAACKRIPDNRFTIHGLWPQVAGGKYPSYCNTSEPYDPNVLVGLRPWLALEWPSLIHNEDSFWSHEWNKHGTCTGMTQLQYFEKVLELNEKYDLMTVLSSAGIVPSDKVKYHFKNVTAALKAGLGAEAQVHCYSGEISEIYMCLSKDFEPFDCMKHDLGHSCKMIGLPLNTIDTFPWKFLKRHIMLFCIFKALLLVIIVSAAVLVCRQPKKGTKMPSSSRKKGKFPTAETALLEDVSP